MFACVDGVIIGAVAVADVVRPESRMVVQAVSITLIALSVDLIFSYVSSSASLLIPAMIHPVYHASNSSQLQKQGLDVWMVTGDNLRTAKAIAASVGITQVSQCSGNRLRPSTLSS